MVLIRKCMEEKKRHVSCGTCFVITGDVSWNSSDPPYCWNGPLVTVWPKTPLSVYFTHSSVTCVIWNKRSWYGNRPFLGAFAILRTRTIGFLSVAPSVCPHVQQLASRCDGFHEIWYSCMSGIPVGGKNQVPLNLTRTTGAIWRCMHRASSYDMYINQQDAQNSCD